MVLTRKGFTQVVGNAYAGFGFAPEGPSVHEFPLAMFEPVGPCVGECSDLTPLKEGIEHIVYGLTKWQPEVTEKGIIYPGEKIAVEGKDYQEALANLNYLFLQRDWGDGLPQLPATDDRVDWILTGTDLSPDTEIGKILPRGGIGTVKMLAIALAMAGGRPEYMPVLIAAMQAILDPELIHQSFNATTCSTYPVLIVNGPIGKQIRLPSGYGCLGPVPSHPAGGSIGRAIRFLLMNVGGAVPGIGTMAIYGGPARYTNIVFAEDEDHLPDDWPPLSVDRGFPAGSNVVTVHVARSTCNTRGGNPIDDEQARTLLDGFATNITRDTQMFGPPGAFDRGGAPGVQLVAYTNTQALSALGWTKEKVLAYLWERSAEIKPSPEKYWAKEPGNLILVVAGGAQGMHSYWMGMGCCAGVPTSAEIELPANWDALLAQAEEDIGPLPAYI